VDLQHYEAAHLPMGTVEAPASSAKMPLAPIVLAVLSMCSPEHQQETLSAAHCAYAQETLSPRQRAAMQISPLAMPEAQELEE
jgi:hypothetical protein